MFFTPRTRGFDCCWRQVPQQGNTLVMFGTVEAPTAADWPVLMLSEDPRIPCDTLELDLTFRRYMTLDRPARSFRPVRFEQPAKSRHFTKINLIWLGALLCTLSIEENPYSQNFMELTS